MKKLYTLALCSAVALGASAEITTLSSAAGLQSATQVLQKISKAKLATKDLVEKTNGMHKAPLKEVSNNWTALGEGTMHECFFGDQSQSGLGSQLGIQPQELTVSVEQNADDASVYRIVEPFKNLGIEDFVYDAAKADPMVLHLSEDGTQYYFDDFCTGVSYGEEYFYVISQVGVAAADEGFAAINAAWNDAFGAFKDGVFTYPMAMIDPVDGGGYYNILVTWGDPNVVDEDGYAVADTYVGNSDGSFKIMIPGAKDYSVAMDIDDCTADNIFRMTYEFGKDVASAKCFVTAGVYGASEGNLAVVAANGSDLPSLAATVGFDFSGTTEYTAATAFVVGLDAEGNVACGKAAWLFVTPNRDAEFESLGTAKYTDDLFTGLYGLDNEEYDVLVEEHKTIKGYYRIKDAYGTAFPYFAYNVHDPEHSHYIYINAADPAAVVLEQSVAGFDMDDGDGVMIFSSYLAENPNANSINKRRYAGKFDEATNTITFPANALRVGFSKTIGDGWYYGNINAGFKLVLPITGGVNSIAADSNEGAAEYFNLQGQRIQTPAAGQLIIKRQGGKAVKVLAK